jgi:hypothetical protein
MSIPKSLFSCFWYMPDRGGREWSLMNYVCLRSAIEKLKPHEAVLYIEDEPQGPWWEETRKFIDIKSVRSPRSIFGRELNHPAHRADVFRLQTLIEFGGIYLDTDVLVQKSFDDLLSHSCVLGEEGLSGKWGLTNAVILAEPEAIFLRRWLKQYQTFRSAGKDRYWNEHSVILPSKLRKIHPNELTVLNYRAFYWPIWNERGLRKIFLDSKPVNDSATYANHLWEQQASRFVQGLTPGVIRRIDTNFNCWARPYLGAFDDDFGGRLDFYKAPTGKSPIFYDDLKYGVKLALQLFGRKKYRFPIVNL